MIGILYYLPGGVPLETVALNRAKNAGILAAQIVSVQDPALREKVIAYKQDLRGQVDQKIEKLEAIGYKAYLK